MPSGTVSGRSTVTSFHVCQPPVGAITGVVRNAGLVGSSKWSSIVPPAPADATRKVTVSRSSRLYGLNEIQSPSSTKAAAEPPPTSVVVSLTMPGSPVAVLVGRRPVVDQNSACLSFVCRIASSLPVTPTAGPLPSSV